MKYLIIQTAFIGDVILATALIEDLISADAKAEIHFLLRKGNESLLAEHPHISKLWVWDKSRKWHSLGQLVPQLRRQRYTTVFNLQRYFSSGLFTLLAGARQRVGFAKNPLSWFFTRRIGHIFADGVHEVDRNHALINDLVPNPARRPRLYPSLADQEAVAPYQHKPYYLIAPTSVWFTKQWPAQKWAQLVARLPMQAEVYLVGAPSDAAACNELAQLAAPRMVHNLAGKLSLLQTAALMRHAQMNYVNDSAPMHLASAVNGPTRAVFCSTVPAFGYTPLADNASVIEIDKPLACRPCGLHGHRACPQGHFRCALEIEVDSRFF